MTKQEVYDYLNAKGIPFEITEHQAVYTMAEMASADIPYPEADAKNLFVRDDKKQHYYLITLKGDKRADLKEFRKRQGLRPLTFASADDLMHFMELTPGSVTPLGVLNDRENAVQVFLDQDFLASSGLIGVHPNENTATIWLKAETLKDLIEEHGNKVSFVQI